MYKKSSSWLCIRSVGVLINESAMVDTFVLSTVIFTRELIFVVLMVIRLLSMLSNAEVIRDPSTAVVFAVMYVEVI